MGHRSEEGKNSIPTFGCSIFGHFDVHAWTKDNASWNKAVLLHTAEDVLRAGELC